MHSTTVIFSKRYASYCREMLSIFSLYNAEKILSARQEWTLVYQICLPLHSTSRDQGVFLFLESCWLQKKIHEFKAGLVGDIFGIWFKIGISKIILEKIKYIQNIWKFPNKADRSHISY